MTVGEHKVPADCGRRLIPVLIDQIAASNPSKTFISAARTVNPEDGFDDISFATLARAINKCAWWLEGTLGKGVGFPTLYTQLAPHDLRHAILVVAAAKVGYKVFFSSPVNTLDSHCALLDKLDCNVFLMPESKPLVGLQILERRPHMRQYPLPSSAFWLNEDADRFVPTYHFTKTFDEARSDPFMVFHSSGTTGTPKPLVFKHGTDAAVDAYQLLPLLGDDPAAWSGMLFRGRRVFTCQPFFHACGLPFLMNAAIYHDFVGVIMPQILKFDVNIISAVHQHGNVSVTYLNPASIIGISQSETHLADLKSIEIMSYAGGALPAKAGDTVAKHCRLLPIFGSTECSSLPVSPPPPGDWNYYRFSPFYGGEFRPHDDGSYELVIVRDARLSAFQTCFQTVSDAGAEYATRDLFMPHPTRSGWWRHVGRRDDVLVFADGRKLNPIAMEARIAAHPAVDAALLVGSTRPKPALMLQAAPGIPTASAADRAAALDTIWPTIAAAVAEAPKSGALTRDMVLFTDREQRPMARAGLKITIQRSKTIALYQAELDAVYAAAAAADQRAATTQASVVAAAGGACGAQETRVGGDAGAHYVYGFQSLSMQTTGLA